MVSVQIPFYLHVVSWSSRWVCNFSRQSFISLLSNQSDPRGCSASIPKTETLHEAYQWNSSDHKCIGFSSPSPNAKHHLGAATRLRSERPFAEFPFALAKPCGHNRNMCLEFSDYSLYLTTGDCTLHTKESKSCQGCCKLLGYNYVSSSKQQHSGTCGHALIIEVLRMLNVQCIELCSSASGHSCLIALHCLRKGLNASMNCRSMLAPYLRIEEEALPEAHLQHQTEWVHNCCLREYPACQSVVVDVSECRLHVFTFVKCSFWCTNLRCFSNDFISYNKCIYHIM